MHVGPSCAWAPSALRSSPPTLALYTARYRQRNALSRGAHSHTTNERAVEGFEKKHPTVYRLKTAKRQQLVSDCNMCTECSLSSMAQSHYGIKPRTKALYLSFGKGQLMTTDRCVLCHLSQLLGNRPKFEICTATTAARSLLTQFLRCSDTAVPRLEKDALTRDRGGGKASWFCCLSYSCEEGSGRSGRQGDAPWDFGLAVDVHQYHQHYRL